jgi:hypothetical protein
MGEERAILVSTKIDLIAAGLDDEARRDPDAIEAVYKKLNAEDEAETARRDLLADPSTVP